jgi:hypothetical protein
MSDDPVAGLVLAFLALLALAVAVPVALAAIAVVVACRALAWLARRGWDHIQGPPVVRELQRVTSERNQAISDIVVLRTEAERRMRAIADENTLEGTAEDW